MAVPKLLHGPRALLAQSSDGVNSPKGSREGPPRMKTSMSTVPNSSAVDPVGPVLPRNVEASKDEIWPNGESVTPGTRLKSKAEVRPWRRTG